MTFPSPSPSPSDPCDDIVCRVTVAEVVTLTGTTVDVATIALMILTATSIVNENLVGVDTCSLEDCTLKLIELYLAAHLVDMNNQVKSEKLGDGADTYGGEFGKGLEFTSWGQQAKILDKCGILASLDAESKITEKKPKFIFAAMGK